MEEREMVLLKDCTHSPIAHCGIISCGFCDQVWKLDGTPVKTTGYRSVCDIPISLTGAR
jgi:hypothetical protein